MLGLTHHERFLWLELNRVQVYSDQYQELKTWVVSASLDCPKRNDIRRARKAHKEGKLLVVKLASCMKFLNEVYDGGKIDHLTFKLWKERFNAESAVAVASIANDVATYGLEVLEGPPPKNHNCQPSNLNCAGFYTIFLQLELKYNAKATSSTQSYEDTETIVKLYGIRAWTSRVHPSAASLTIIA
ncbi:uncharacterized protein CcaverHIS019_0411210 [Cutaneotrichosporon cavernicola]|uniref:Uncharacterized protein n=1 Tax=Cutaneotrichosporon cavernicola TaxID=279322 RepID=A0AA48L5D8_9TREE|nr:uncharacterized protein CcaverHIS019_0411210 [Cutaneotrichosporon cavernicola]BEI92301.1 hypothetical protein CcaverHIS019_0411210 [Cutaneotrichosporon cavernicola]